MTPRSEFKHQDFTPIILPDGKTQVLVRRLHPEAAAVLSDYDETISARRECDLITDHGEEVLKDDHLKNTFYNDANAGFALVKDEKFNGEIKKIRQAIHTIQNAHHNIFCTVSFTYSVEVQQKRLQESLGIDDADFVICDIGSLLNKAAEQPKFKVIQDPANPKPNVIVMVGGYPTDEAKVTKMDPGHHIEWAKTILKLFGWEDQPGKTIFMDDSERHYPPARQAGIHTIPVTRIEDGGTGKHWSTVVAKSLELMVSLPYENYHRATKVGSSILAGGTSGYFAGSTYVASVAVSSTATVVLGMSAPVFIGLCTIAGAGLLLLVTWLINRYKTGRPGFFPSALPSHSKKDGEKLKITRAI